MELSVMSCLTIFRAINGKVKRQNIKCLSVAEYLVQSKLPTLITLTWNYQSYLRTHAHPRTTQP